MSEVDELKARIEQIKGESESKLKQIADQSSTELRKLQESWCAFHRERHGTPTNRLTALPPPRSDGKYSSLEKSSEERYKGLETKLTAQLSKAEKDAADNDARLKKEAAASGVMAEEKYNSLVAEKKSAEKGASNLRAAAHPSPLRGHPLLHARAWLTSPWFDHPQTCRSQSIKLKGLTRRRRTP